MLTLLLGLGPTQQSKASHSISARHLVSVTTYSQQPLNNSTQPPNRKGEKTHPSR